LAIIPPPIATKEISLPTRSTNVPPRDLREDF
jgi:hypothetical protein